MFSSTVRFVVISSLVLAFTNACSDGGTGGGGGAPAVTNVETYATPQVIVLGKSFQVTCMALNDAGTYVSADMRFAIEPEAGFVGNTVTPSQAGTYFASCMLNDDSVKDSTPAAIYVIGPDDVDDVVVETSLPKNKAALNEAVEAKCDVTFKGDPIDVVTTVESSPVDGMQITDHTLVGTIAQIYKVACRIAATEFVDATPAVLKVGGATGQPAKIVTQLSKATAKSGEQVQVTCVVTDEDGEELSSPTWVDAPVGVGVQGHVITTQQAGTFDITCRLAEDGPTVELVPAELVVVSSGPVAIKASIQPQKPVYRPSDIVTISWVATDGFGNVVDPTPAATVTGTLTGTNALGNNKFTLLENGYITFKVALVDDASITDTPEITVDDKGPQVVIDTPKRGTTRDGDPLVSVQGKVWDDFGGVASLTVNGLAVSWDPQGNWSFNIGSVQGMNLVVAEAKDVHGNTGKAIVAWYYSTDYKVIDVLQPDKAYLNNAVQVWLSQEIIDDNDHTGPIDDLAHLLELVLTNANLADLTDQSKLGQQTYKNVIDWEDAESGLSLVGDVEVWAEIKNMSFGQAKLNLKSRGAKPENANGGIDLVAQFIPQGDQPGVNVEIEVHVALILNGEIYTGLPVCEYMTATIDPPPQFITTTKIAFDSLDADTSFDIYMDPNGELQVDGKKLKVLAKGSKFSPLAGAMLDLGKLNFSFKSPDPALDFFCKAFKIDNVADFGKVDLTALVSGFDAIIGAVLDVAVDTVGPLAAQVLEPLIAVVGGDTIEMALKTLEIDQTVGLPTLLPQQLDGELQIKAKITSLFFTDAGATVLMSGLSVAEKKVSYQPLGSIMRDQCLGQEQAAYVLPKDGPMQFALSLDLLNEVLYSAWYNGGLDLTVDAESLVNLSTYGIEKASFTLAPLLPPIMSDCNPKSTLKVQLGDTYMEASVKFGDIPVDFKAWVGAEIDIGLVAKDAELSLVINGISQFEIEIFDVKGPLEGMESAIETLVGDLLLEKLLGGLTSGALGNFPVPQFDLTGLSADIPDGTKIGLGQMQIKKSKGFLQIEGTLQ